MSTPAPPEPPSAEAVAALAARAPIRKGGNGIDQWGITPDGTRGGGATREALASLLGARGVLRYDLVTGLQGNSTPRPLTVDLAGVADSGRRIVIADMREFRAKLPFRLYNSGMEEMEGWGG